MDNNHQLPILDQGYAFAKEFVSKLIIPSIEETGLLLRDQIVLWRLKNQIKILNKAQAYCEKNNISPKKISLKILVPLLDYSSIEEEAVLQDKWAILLSNLVDSEKNVENHVFPYILSQLSINEYLILEKAFDSKKYREERLSIELEKFRQEKPYKVKKGREQIELLKEKVYKLRKGGNWREVWNLEHEISEIDKKLRFLEFEESSINSKILALELISSSDLKKFELTNLIRLGLVKEEKEFYADSQTFEIPKENHYNEGVWDTVKLDIDLGSIIEIVLTELGELFISACKEKIVS